MWLEAVCRILHQRNCAEGGGIATITCSHYLDRYPRAGFIAMPEGSWGAEGDHQVWMNPDTSWTYTHIYPAESFTREVCTSPLWRTSELGTRIVQQLCRELLLLESSDWQFLITTGAARDYAESRFLTHNDQFLELKSIWQAFEHDGALNEHMHTRLAAIEQRDNIFPGIDPALWAAGALRHPHPGLHIARRSLRFPASINSPTASPHCLSPSRQPSPWSDRSSTRSALAPP